MTQNGYKGVSHCVHGISKPTFKTIISYHTIFQWQMWSLLEHMVDHLDMQDWNDHHDVVNNCGDPQMRCIVTLHPQSWKADYYNTASAFRGRTICPHNIITGHSQKFGSHWSCAEVCCLKALARPMSLLWDSSAATGWFMIYPNESICPGLLLSLHWKEYNYQSNVCCVLLHWYIHETPNLQ